MEATITFHEDCTFTLDLPDMDDEMIVPDNILFAASAYAHLAENGVPENITNRFMAPSAPH